MGYIEQNLMPGERIIYKAQLHWGMFSGSVIWVLIGLLLVLCAFTGDSDTTSGILGFGVLVFLSAVLTVISGAVTYLTTEFALTDKRIIAKTGLIRRRSLELLLTKLESVGVNQPIMGRILNYGTITVTGTGGTKEPFKNIADPLELRRQVHTRISEIS